MVPTVMYEMKTLSMRMNKRNKLDVTETKNKSVLQSDYERKEY